MLDLYIRHPLLGLNTKLRVTSLAPAYIRQGLEPAISRINMAAVYRSHLEGQWSVSIAEVENS